jgi:hypothetical protein
MLEPDPRRAGTRILHDKSRACLKLVIAATESFFGDDDERSAVRMPYPGDQRTWSARHRPGRCSCGRPGGWYFNTDVLQSDRHRYTVPTIPRPITVCRTQDFSGSITRAFQLGRCHK